jgi:ankyrin repeat protein
VFCSLYILSQLPSKMLKLPTSPLKVTLKLVDASAIICTGPNTDDGRGYTPLHCSANMSDPSQEHTLENQCILAKQLIEAGANVNACAQRYLYNYTPLHEACSSGNSTNLDFIQLLFDHGANPNAKDSDDGATPLHHTMINAPGSVKFFLRTRTRLILTFSGMMDDPSSPRFIGIVWKVHPQRDFHTIRTRKNSCFW